MLWGFSEHCASCVLISEATAPSFLLYSELLPLLPFLPPILTGPGAMRYKCSCSRHFSAWNLPKKDFWAAERKAPVPSRASKAPWHPAWSLLSQFTRRPGLCSSNPRSLSPTFSFLQSATLLPTSGSQLAGFSTSPAFSRHSGVSWNATTAGTLVVLCSR